MATELVARPPDRVPLTSSRIMAECPEVADAYAELFSDLQLARPGASGNSILVTSAEPGEGKTTVSSCLAVTASIAGRSALLIDGDLRRLSLTTAVGRAGSAGLIELLLDQDNGAMAIHPVRAWADSPRAGAINFMAGGRKPSLFLGAVDWPRARATSRSIAQEFGFVILDSPPVLAANDALLFAGIVDAVLLVVRTGNDNLNGIRRVKEQLSATGTPILGVVLNRFRPKVHGPSHRPYSGYHRGART